MHLKTACLILATCLSTYACSASPAQSQPGAAVLEYKIDRSNQAYQIVLGLPARFVEPPPPAFTIKTQEGYVSAWRAANVAIDGDAAAVTLSPKQHEVLPRVNDSALVSFVDRSSNLQITLPTSTVERAPDQPRVVNPNFANWVWPPGQFGIPQGWSLDGSATSYYYEPLLETTGGVRFSVAEALGAPRGLLNTEALDQTVELRGPKLVIRMRPFQECIVARMEKAYKLVAAAGVAASDVFGRKEIFCITARRHRFVASIPQYETLIVFLPGRIGQWNNIDVDVRSAWPDFASTPTLDRRVTLQVIAEMLPVASPYSWITIDVGSLATE